MKVIQPESRSTAFELHEVLGRNMTPDGQSMLLKFPQGGFMQKVPTDTVIMTPTTTDSVALDELNKIIQNKEVCLIDDPGSETDTATTVAHHRRLEIRPAILN